LGFKHENTKNVEHSRTTKQLAKLRTWFTNYGLAG